ncbi:MAG: NAD(P)H-hydrate epimerase [Alkalispirochaeta sp.]
MQAVNRIVTASEMAEIDRRAQQDFGLSGLILMENAGQKAWEVVRGYLRNAAGERPRSRIAFVAGNGNNGGDALVMARQCLIDGEDEVLIITAAYELKGAVREQWNILHRLGARRLVWEREPEAVSTAIDTVAWVVDGISGIGISGALRDPLGTLVNRINGSSAGVFSVDVPSGVRDRFHPGDPAIRADVTVVTGYLKTMLFEPHLRELAGEIRTVDPGFPPTLINDSQVVASRITLMPHTDTHPVPIGPDLHKGHRGRVLVVGGSPGTAGAAVLSVEGAIAAGAGMVRALTSRFGVSAVLARTPSVMADELTASIDDSAVDDALSWADVVVLGPGWTDLTDEDLANWLARCETTGAAVVLDAAALRVIARRGAAWNQLVSSSFPAVLTPHIGEWQTLVASEGGDGDVRETLERFPSRPDLTVIVKSAVSWIRHATNEVDVLDGRAPALAVAGSGDVLSGVLAGALARAVAAGQHTPEVMRDAVRWALTRHLHAGRSLEADGRRAPAAEIAARVACGDNTHNG